jgi:4-diphosphocytidyl-2-C-methyl-D-erythritol kinase
LRLEAGSNDFEEVVFEQHGSLAVLKRRLLRAGAFPAMMTGSGSALFGLFPSAREAARAERSLGEERSFRISLVSRARYRSIWRRALEEHTTGTLWPPQSRNAR